MKHFLFLPLLISQFVIAQQNCPCCDSLHRQFDFWIGDWNVYNDEGQLIGSNLIEVEKDSCVLKENWEGLKGGTGISINFYDQKTTNGISTGLVAAEMS